MNITFENGKPVTVNPTWKDSAGNSSTKPAGIKLVVNDTSVRIADNGDGTWTIYPQRKGNYTVTGEFKVPITSATQTPKREVSTDITITPTVIV